MIAWLAGGILIGLSIGGIAGLLFVYHLLKDLWP